MVKGVTSNKGAVVCCPVGVFDRLEAADTTLETAAWGPVIACVQGERKGAATP
jgi:hypothetical protein